MTASQKQWIDDASYEQMLRRWRNSAPGDEMFVGETGQYYVKVMAEKRQAVGVEGHVAASKSIERS